MRQLKVLEKIFRISKLFYPALIACNVALALCAMRRASVPTAIRVYPFLIKGAADSAESANMPSETPA